MIIDVHGHLGNINMAPFWQADAETLESYLDEAGVDQLWISSSRSLMYDVREGNAEMAAALERTEKLRGYVVINPIFPESLEDLALLDNPKFLGVKIHPDYHGYEVDSAQVRECLDEVADRVDLILTHTSCMPGTGFAGTDELLAYASRHPGTRFILAHLAGVFQNGLYPYFPNLRGLEKVNAAALANVFVDTAHHLIYVYPGVMDRMVELIGADHIVYGTDCPLQGPKQMGFALEIIKGLDIPAEDRDKILFANALSLMGASTDSIKG